MRWINGLSVVYAALFFYGSSSATVLPAISSQDLGSVAVNSTANLSFQISGFSSTPDSFALKYGTEFSVGSPACTTVPPISCTVGVSFHPKYPGVRQDAVQVLGGGVLLNTTLLHGIGLASQSVIRPGVMTKFAGTGTLGISGDNGLAVNARLENPQAVAVDSAGNIYIADSLAQVVRKVNATSGVITTVAGSVNNSAVLNAPTGVAVDGAGNLYIADSQNNRIRRVDAVSGVMTTVTFTRASLKNPTDVDVDPRGNLYIADGYNNCIRRIDAVTGVISIVAGGGTPVAGDGLGNGGLAVNAVLNDPSGVALDAAGNLYIADSGDNLIREVSDGIISVVAGNGKPDYTGDGGAAINASLNQPVSVRVDAGGNLYIADSHNNRIRKVNGAGIISTVARQLNNPGGLALDASGNIYIADQGDSVVEKIASGPSALSYSATPVGQINATLQAISIENIGNQVLNFSGFSIGGGDFQQVSSSDVDCALDVTLQAASSCSVALAFAPQTASTLNENLSLLTNSLNSTSGALQSIIVGLSGRGTTGNLSVADPTVSVTSLLFGSQPAGTGSSAAQTVVLSNPGSTALSVTMSLSSSSLQDFPLPTNCNSIAARGTCTVSLTFTPHSAGPKSATLTLTETNTSGALFSQSVFLQGLATQPLLTATPSIAFGNQAVGTTSAAQTVTLTNPSSVSLAILSAVLSGSSDFVISSNTCSSVSSNSSCTVVLIFRPTSVGLEQASLVFNYEAGNSPQTVTIQGTGVVPVLQPAGGLSVANIGETALVCSI